MIIFDIGWNLILWYKLKIYNLKKIVVGLSDLLVVIILIIG